MKKIQLVLLIVISLLTIGLVGGASYMSYLHTPGKVEVRSGNNIIKPSSNTIYEFNGLRYLDCARLRPHEVENPPVIDASDSLAVILSGGIRKREPYYSVYSFADLEKEPVCTDSLKEITTPGQYLVFFEIGWGDDDYNVGMQYHFQLNIHAE